MKIILLCVIADTSTTSITRLYRRSLRTDLMLYMHHHSAYSCCSVDVNDLQRPSSTDRRPN